MSPLPDHDGKPFDPKYSCSYHEKAVKLEAEVERLKNDIEFSKNPYIKELKDKVKWLTKERGIIALALKEIGSSYEEMRCSQCVMYTIEPIPVPCIDCEEKGKDAFELKEPAAAPQPYIVEQIDKSLGETMDALDEERSFVVHAKLKWPEKPATAPKPSEEKKP